MDFDAWLEDHSDTLRTFSGKRVFLLYSGGKDSSLCHPFMVGSSHFGFDLEARAGPYPLHRYTHQKRKGYRPSGMIEVWKLFGIVLGLPVAT